MANFAKEVRGSHRKRAEFLSNSKKYTHDLLADDRKFMKDVAADLKVMAEEVKDFLAKSETRRRADFKAVMEGVHSALNKIRANVKSIAKDTSNLLGAYKADRKEAASAWPPMKGHEGSEKKGE